MIDFQNPPADSQRPEQPDDTPHEGRKKNQPPTVSVRYGRMGHLGDFMISRGIKVPLEYGAKVVIQTDRGVEIGEPLALTCSGCKNAVPKEDVRTYVKNSGSDFLRSRAGRVLRLATHDDLVEERHILAQKDEKMRVCRSMIARHELDMKLVDCEHVFGGERIVFYFMSDHRIDFRELVRDLGSEFQTRIEMRQVGARDEARLVADYETCGRECCCKNFLKTLRPVSMRNAKMQKATLDPSKVSGRCGRLKCCLRYEQETYEELNKQLPRIGETVETPEGPGVVVDRQILTQLLWIQREGKQAIVLGVEQLGGKKQSPESKADSEEPARPQDIADDWTMLDPDTMDKKPADEDEAKSQSGTDQSRPDGREQQSGAEGTDSSRPRRRRRKRGGRGRGRGGNRPNNPGSS